MGGSIPTEYRHDAFFAYSHGADGLLVRELQRLINGVSERQSTRGRLRLFRDDVSLSATPNLWDAIQTALESSRYFLFFASRQAAQSPWVSREVLFWRQHRESSSILLLLTDGEIQWSNRDHDMDWSRTTALPSALSGWFADEPRWFDLRVARHEAQVGQLNSLVVEEAAIEVAAVLYGIPKEELWGEVKRERFFTTRSSLRNELRIREAQLRQQAARLQRQEFQLQQQAQRLQELAAFDQEAERTGGVFVSYSHADSDVVDALTARFDVDRINYWRDDKDLLVGDVVDRAISRGIQQSILFLVLLTPSSVKSKWVQRELDEAAHEEVEGSKIVLPVVAKGLQSNAIPHRLRRKLYVDISGNAFDSGYARLAQSIKRHLGNVSADKQAP
ncbi:toll/interleukin-1 receptor domain-containing protein [Geodermatophilus sp. SYSU D00710]